MIPRGALGGTGAIKCGTMYIAAQFMIISWSVACLFRCFCAGARACLCACTDTPRAVYDHLVQRRVPACVHALTSPPHSL